MNRGFKMGSASAALFCCSMLLSSFSQADSLGELLATEADQGWGASSSVTTADNVVSLSATRAVAGGDSGYGLTAATEVNEPQMANSTAGIGTFVLLLLVWATILAGLNSRRGRTRESDIAAGT